jgi:hypothetical protein
MATTSPLKKTLIGTTMAFAFAATPANASSSFEKTGDILQIGVPLGALLFSAARSDHEGVDLMLGHCARTSLIVEGMKKSFNGTAIGTRPNGGNNNFPSGHAAGAYCGAAYIHARHGLRDSLPAYALATMVGMSRIDANKHTSLAVGTSFVLNYLVARHIVGTDKMDKPSNLMITPYVLTPDSQGQKVPKYGIGINYKF